MLPPLTENQQPTAQSYISHAISSILSPFSYLVEPAWSTSHDETMELEGWAAQPFIVVAGASANSNRQVAAFQSVLYTTQHG